jgi:hypothetical protein
MFVGGLAATLVVRALIEEQAARQAEDVIAGLAVAMAAVEAERVCSEAVRVGTRAALDGFEVARGEPAAELVLAEQLGSAVEQDEPEAVAERAWFEAAPGAFVAVLVLYRVARAVSVAALGEPRVDLVSPQAGWGGPVGSAVGCLAVRDVPQAGLDG